MGIEIFPVFHPPVPAAAFEGCGRALLDHYAVLDDVSAELGLQHLSAFGDNRVVPDGFEGDPSGLDHLLGELDAWHSIDDGLETVDGLVVALGSNTKVAARFDDTALIQSTLTELAKSMRVARQSGARFRLEVG